jgi:hypothetical protein
VQDIYDNAEFFAGYSEMRRSVEGPTGATLRTTLTTLMRSGFTLTHVEEWAPMHEQIEARPEVAQERERPIFLLLAAHK